MITTPTRGAQRGATLIVGLIMLALITLMVVTTFTLSTTNLQSVGNMQFRDESIAAATRAIEISFSDTTMPAGIQVGDTGSPRNFAIDVNNNGVADYTVSVCPEPAFAPTPLPSRPRRAAAPVAKSTPIVAAQPPAASTWWSGTTTQS
jgi:Tfp pilus assembly protein PilX